jgi:hypothetical protein
MAAIPGESQSAQLARGNTGNSPQWHLEGDRRWPLQGDEHWSAPLGLTSPRCTPISLLSSAADQKVEATFASVVSPRIATLSQAQASQVEAQALGTGGKPKSRRGTHLGPPTS